MATTSRRSVSDLAAAAAAAPFSYAQAAKGLSPNTPSSGHTSKPSSGSATPSKDAGVASQKVSLVPSSMNWADAAEASVSGADQATDKSSNTPPDFQVVNGLTSSQPPKSLATPLLGATAGIPSPDLATSSSSIAGKEDDTSSIPNASSESTWENKSQASNSVDKSTDHSELDSEKGKDREPEKERISSKPLQDAPPPSVNIWKRRADEAAKAKASYPVTSKSSSHSAAANLGPQTDSKTAPAAETVAGGAAVASAKSDGRKKAKGGSANRDGEQLATSATSERRQSHANPTNRTRDDEKPNATRKDGKSDFDGEQRSNKKGGFKGVDKEDKSSKAAPLPPVRDQESWPTPESAQDEGKRRAQEKNEKSDKDRAAATARSHGKNEWVPVPITPSVIFNTPLPNTASRRGGRGGRGGSQGGAGRGAASNANGSGDKDAQPTGVPNGEVSKRNRSDTTTLRDQSPPKPKASAVNGTAKENKSAGVDRAGKLNATDDTNAGATTNKSGTDDTQNTASSQSYGNSNTNTNSGARQPLPNRQKVGRKFEPASGVERRRDGGEVTSPSSGDGTSARRTSIATQTDDGLDRRQNSISESGHFPQKGGHNDRRGGAFGSFSSRERGEGGGRGRGSMRGRGGYSNHHGNSPSSYTNGQPTPTQSSPSTFSLPRSPTTFHPEQSSFFPAAPHTGGYRSNSSRSQAMSPNEPLYGRMAPVYPAAPQPISPIQTTYMGAGYDYNMMQPMSAVPYSPYVDQYSVLGMVSLQLEYYFSVDNLCKDMYLRKHMDSKGFVFLSFIADFNRIKQLTTDLELIKLACFQSRNIEFRVGVDGKDRLRRREGWDKWILSMPERDPSAQNDGPAEVHNPPTPHPQGIDPQYMVRYPPGPAGMPPIPGILPNEMSYQNLSAVAPASAPASAAVGPGEQPMGPIFTDAALPRALVSPTMINGNAAAPLYQPATVIAPDAHAEKDSFSDEQIESLTVIVRQQDSTQPPASAPSLATRTFSNGSIDLRGNAEDQANTGARRTSVQINGNGHIGADENQKVQSAKRDASPSDKQNSTSHMGFFWVKGKDAPEESLPEDAACELYTELHDKALEQRQNGASGSCPYDMHVLYQFWSHFLIRNFNTGMYNEFRHLAFEDISQRSSDVGMKNLIKYYGEALSSQSIIRERVARHYVELAKDEDPITERPAFKQLRSAWRNGALNLKNRKKITGYVDNDLRVALEQ